MYKAKLEEFAELPGIIIIMEEKWDSEYYPQCFMQPHAIVAVITYHLGHCYGNNLIRN